MDRDLRAARVDAARAPAGTASPCPAPRRSRPAAPRRPEHAELPARPVLARARAVRVEQVALVQHRVGDGADVVQARTAAVGGRSRAWRSPGHLSRSRPAATSTVSSQLISPRRARKSASSPRTSLVQPEPAAVGEVAPIRPRQTATGIAMPRLAVPWHLLDPEPAPPRVKTVPENSRASGTSPSPSACRYLRRRDLEVVRARQREVDLGGAAEALHHRAALHPQERLEGVGPALARRRTGRAGRRVSAVS